MASKAIYHAYRLGAAVARTLPEKWIPAFEQAGGRVAGRLMTTRRDQVERNLERIYGPGLSERAKHDLITETFSSYTRYWIESFRLPHMTPAEINSGVQLENYEAIAKALDGGNGLVIAMPHIGGYDWAAFWLASYKQVAVSSVAEAVEPPELAEWFLSYRRNLGIEIYPLGPSAGTDCARALKQNRLVCLVSDRDIAGGGIEVPLLGETTTLPAGPATLALRSGAPLLTAATYFDGRNHRFVVHDPIDTTRQASLRNDVVRITSEIAKRFETLIRQAPEQWHMMQPNWPSDRDGKPEL